MFSPRQLSARALRQAAGSWTALAVPRASVAGHGVREFGRHPKHDPKPSPIDRQLPTVKEMTADILKTPKRKEWIRQPFPHSKLDSVEEHKEKRAVYLYQRSLPAPIVEEVLQGCHTRLSPEATVRRWWFVDANNKVVGNLATQLVKVLMGKHKPIFEPSKVMGDFVVVINAEKVHLTGRKKDQNVYRYHTGWPGGLVETSHKQMIATKPIEVLRRAVAGMLPKNLLRKERLKLLRIFAGPEHPHHAEQPLPMPNFLNTPSPWVVKTYVPPFVRPPFVQDEFGNAWPELTDNHGVKYTKEEVELMISQGTTVYDKAWEEANLDGLIKPPPKKK
mmetsp:Transcript_43847/g.104211  ORF Transcript_43847/g.104211 Transcript_43847/m.104211 type:complete len:333 (-) Transcript_43847:191-1189(-)